MGNNDTNLKLANVIFDLAKNAEESGKYEDAIKSYKEVLNVFEQALGAEDEKTKEVYTNIGMCYKALGKNEEALTYLTKALSSSNTTSVVQKQETAIAKQDTEVEEAEDEELEEEDEELILLREADSLYALGKENLGNKKYKEAIEYFKEALRIFNEVEGEGSESSAYMYEYIANCYFDEKNYNEAINYYAWALEIFDKMPDSDNDQSRYCCERLDYCYERLDNYKDTKYYLEECLEIENNRVDLGLYSMEAFTQTYDLSNIAKDKSKKIYEYYKKNPEKLLKHMAIAKKVGKKLWEIYKMFK
ncbi:MAG: tetratricopeptide repeat protein [Bacteroidales bacterium]|nr:tetratricopeptide repeat protein [Bacteroidales bacterium]